jgi:hypothetical protein
VKVAIIWAGHTQGILSRGSKQLPPSSWPKLTHTLFPTLPLADLKEQNECNTMPAVYGSQLGFRV